MDPRLTLIEQMLGLADGDADAMTETSSASQY
jgi:hypothetical protein